MQQYPLQLSKLPRPEKTSKKSQVMFFIAEAMIFAQCSLLPKQCSLLPTQCSLLPTID